MVAKPMEGDGPQARDPYSNDNHITIAELISSCDDNADLLGALSYSRGWTEDVPKDRLQPWQQVGPEVLWAVNRQTDAELSKVGPVVSDYVCNLRWVRQKRLSRLQIESAVYDAFERLVFGECMTADLSAMMVACRKETFLDLRAEAVAFMVFSMGMSEARVRDQLRNGN